jgi:hypothetical protein
MSGTTVPLVTFDYGLWSAAYPELACSITEPQTEQYVLMVPPFLDITGCGEITDPTQATFLLNLLVAHIAALFGSINGNPSSQLTGRISTASEGSVSVSTEMKIGEAGAWFSQTKYGLMFWAATARYRLARYIPSRRAMRYNSAFGGFGGIYRN